MAAVRLTRTFFAARALELAPRLLGMCLVHETPQGRTAAVLTEVEAYEGEEDPASHAFRGPTPRSAIMFGPPGHAYVYLSYGIHHCLNIVCGPVGTASAVLVRAAQPREGLELMAVRRGLAAAGAVPRERLCAGPGMLAQAFGLTRAHNGADLLAGSLRLEGRRAVPVASIVRTSRIGIRVATERPWRFVAG